MVWSIRPDTNARNQPEIITKERDPHYDALRGGERFSSAVVAAFKAGRKIEHPEWIPKTVYVPKPRKTYSPIIAVWEQFAVQQNVVDLIEEFEPSVHEFFPLGVALWKTDELQPVTYFVVNVCKRLDSVVLDDGAVGVKRVGDRTYWFQRDGSFPYSFRRDVVSGNHIWRDTGSISNIFASDAFVAALESNNVLGFLKNSHHDEI